VIADGPLQRIAKEDPPCYFKDGKRDWGEGRKRNWWEGRNMNGDKDTIGKGENERNIDRREGGKKDWRKGREKERKEVGN
jgi:hypothetical protein